MKHPLFLLLGPTDKRRILVLMTLTLVFAILELAGIGGIGIVVDLAINRERISQIPHLTEIAGAFGVVSDDGKFLFVVSAFLIFLLFRNLAGTVILWYRLRFQHQARRDLSTRLIDATMHRPYPYFLAHNSAKISKTILNETSEFVNSYIFGWIVLVTDTLLIAGVFAMLLYIDIWVTMVVTALFGGFGAVTFLGLRKQFRIMGANSRRELENMFRVTGEALSGIKEIKLRSCENTFVRLFRAAADSYARLVIRFMVFKEVPRFLLETIAITIIGLFVLAYSTQSLDYQISIGVLGSFAFATYRLLPIVHRLISALGGMSFSRSAMESMVEVLSTPPETGRVQPGKIGPPLPMEHSVALKNASVRYENAHVPALDMIDLSIAKGECIGVVGVSGAGKSTLVDALLGLLPCDAGSLEVDGKPVGREDMRRWQQNIAYVPQTIYLMDSSIRENVAFGADPTDIDDERVMDAVRNAQLEDFVSSLPNGLDSMVGEGGARVSGGQRQRLAIARALYHRASVLVLDEATSALDNRTEAAVRESIESLKGKLTQVIVAHRLSTIRACDRVIMLDQGRIVAAGDFDTLERTNESFRNLVHAHA